MDAAAENAARPLRARDLPEDCHIVIETEADSDMITCWFTWQKKDADKAYDGRGRARDVNAAILNAVHDAEHGDDE